MKLPKQQKKTGLYARRVEQGSFTPHKTEKNPKVPRKVICINNLINQSYFAIPAMRKKHKENKESKLT